MLTKQEILLERAPGWRAVGKGTQNCSASWLEVLGFMVMGLVSGWSLANHSNSESFLMVHVHSAKVDASERDSGKMLARGTLGSGRTRGVSF